MFNKKIKEIQRKLRELEKGYLDVANRLEEGNDFFDRKVRDRISELVNDYVSKVNRRNEELKIAFYEKKDTAKKIKLEEASFDGFSDYLDGFNRVTFLSPKIFAQ